MKNAFKHYEKDIEQIIGKDNVLYSEPMAKHTTFKIGGPADIFATPKTTKAITALLSYTLDNNLPYFILGKGSNIIVSDKGIRGLVISTEKLTSVSYKDDNVSAGCGVELKKLSHRTASRNLSGLEFACGIPGSVGGAVYMNAGAYESEISKVLLSSNVLHIDVTAPKGQKVKKITLTNKEHDFSYRHSVLQDKSYIHLSSTFALEPKNQRVIMSAITKFTESRAAKQPWEYPSAGSIFRRPQGFFTGMLIGDCGLSGYRIGDAAISEKHNGFIVNLGKATAQDVLSLIEHVNKSIKAKCGITLKTEVQFVGEQ
jgi:UDP-N-acetylmuramate dehydrogenase